MDAKRGSKMQEASRIELNGLFIVVVEIAYVMLDPRVR